MLSNFTIISSKGSLALDRTAKARLSGTAGSVGSELTMSAAVVLSGVTLGKDSISFSSVWWILLTLPMALQAATTWVAAIATKRDRMKKATTL